MRRNPRIMMQIDEARPVTPDVASCGDTQETPLEILAPGSAETSAGKVRRTGKVVACLRSILWGLRLNESRHSVSSSTHASNRLPYSRDG